MPFNFNPITLTKKVSRITKLKPLSTFIKYNISVTNFCCKNALFCVSKSRLIFIYLKFPLFCSGKYFFCIFFVFISFQIYRRVYLFCMKIQFLLVGMHGDVKCLVKCTKCDVFVICVRLFLLEMLHFVLNVRTFSLIFFLFTPHRSHLWGWGGSLGMLFEERTE